MREMISQGWGGKSIKKKSVKRRIVSGGGEPVAWIRPRSLGGEEKDQDTSVGALK